MLRKTSLLLATLFLQHALSSPYPLTNTTTALLPLPTANLTNTTTTPPARNTSRPTLCEQVYPSDLTILNARYPDYNRSNLHGATQLFMLRRQLPDDGEIATRVQFTGLPGPAANLSCRLEFVLPRPDLQIIAGFNPSFHVYQVEREAGAAASWATYEGNRREGEGEGEGEGGAKGKDGAALLFGTVNGEPEALERTRSVGGVAAVNETLCRETLSFQMGMKYNGRMGPNYWEFANVAPPAWPVQGWRVVFGC